MALFPNMRIRTRFLPIPLLASLCIGTLLMVFFSVFWEVHLAMERFSAEELPKTEAINTAYLEFSSHYVDTFGFMVLLRSSEDEERIYEVSQRYIDGVHALVKDFDSLAALYGSGAADTAHFESLRQRIRDYRDVVIAAIQHASVDLDMAYEILLKANSHYNDINRHFDALLDRSFADSARSVAAIEEKFEQRLFLSLGVGVVSLAVLLAGIMILSRRITTPILNLTGNIQRITERRDYDLVVPKETGDELGELADSFNLMLATVRDAQNDLKAEKTYLNTIMDNMMQGVVTIDEAGTIRTFNHWAEQLFGYEAGELVGRNVKILMPEPYRSEHDAYLRNYKATGNAKIIGRDRDVEGVRKTGESFPMALSVTEMGVGGERIFVGLCTDISEQKERERLLRQAKDEADRANAAKSEFLANMSHEVRTPLNSILGLSRMFVDEPGLDEDHRAMANTVHKSAVNLMEIVNDILDISKIEAGSMVLEEVGFDFKDLLASIMEIMAPVASGKGVSLVYHYADDTIPYLVGDPLRISRILTNLVGNAIKYTDKGQVQVTTECSPLPDGRQEICCTVADTGIGIARDKLDVIFDKFTQADESTTRKYGGTGLGLTISRDLVELMGGTIGADSEIGEGSVFWFRIPLAVTDTIDEAPTRRERRKAVNHRAAARRPVWEARILVAEDHAFNQDFVRRLLRRMGLNHVTFVEDGARALEAHAGGPLDLILMDCHMPGMNGYEAATEIRRRERGTGAHVPIVALTADAMKGVYEKCRAAGMDEYMTKPIDSDELRDVLSNWIDFEDSEGEDGQAAPAAQAAAGMEAATGDEKAGTFDLTFFEEVADTPEEVAHFIGTFFAQSEAAIAILRGFCLDGPCSDWTEAAHKFKGLAGMAGAGRLHGLCGRAQDMPEATADDRDRMLADITAEYETVKRNMTDTVAATAAAS